MIKALLITDGRDIDDVDRQSFSERLNLMQKHTVVLARQFTMRNNVFMWFLKRNNDCLGGPIEVF